MARYCISRSPLDTQQNIRRQRANAREATMWSAETPEGPDSDRVLTWRQRKILRFVRDSVQRHGYPPSMREIGDAVGLASTSSVSYQLAALERKGYLRRNGRRPRTAEVRLPSRPAVPEQRKHPPAYVPMVSRLNPGVPVLADEQIDDVVPLPKRLVGDGTLFLLEMAGDSMINAAVADGDWLVVRQQAEAEDGAIVAAMIDGEAVVRRLNRSDGRDWLVPHHPAFVPLLADNATILGIVVALLRRVQPVPRRA
jgi:repressor LexA